MAAASIERITCPIGAVGIAGRAPEVIAMAAVAELLRVASGAASKAADAAVDEQVDAGDVRGRVRGEE